MARWAGPPILFPLYHPAAGLRSTLLREASFEDARALGALLSEGEAGADDGPGAWRALD